MDIQQLIEQKRQQLAKLQAQLEVLEELAGEAGASRGQPSRGRRGRGRPARGGRSGRAGRGANQRKVLAVLSGTPQRSKEIAAAAGISPAATAQVLLGLKNKAMVTQAGRGLYKLGGRSPAAARGAAAATPRPARSRKRPRKGKKRRSKAGPAASRSTAATPAPEAQAG